MPVEASHHCRPSVRRQFSEMEFEGAVRKIVESLIRGSLSVNSARSYPTSTSLHQVVKPGAPHSMWRVFEVIDQT